MTEFVSPHDEFEIQDEEEKLILESGEDEKEPESTIEIPEELELSEDVEPDPAPTPPPTKTKKPTPRAEQRIGILTRKNRDLETERNQLLAERAQWLAYIQEQQKQSETETAALRTKTAESLKADMQRALDEGNTDKFLQLQDQYLETKTAARTPLPPIPQSQAQTQPQSQLSETEQAWVTQSGFQFWPEEAKKDAINIFSHLKQNLGMDPEDGGFWNTLDSKLKKIPNFDKLYAIFGTEDEEMPAETPTKTLQNPKTPGKLTLQRGQSPSRSGPIAGAGDKKQGYTLTNHDKQTMRMFGFDVNDPEQVASFLKHRT